MENLTKTIQIISHYGRSKIGLTTSSVAALNGTSIRGFINNNLFGLKEKHQGLNIHHWSMKLPLLSNVSDHDTVISKK